MKKLFFFVAITTFTAGTMVSCGKSTKGKMDAEWTIDSAADKTTSTDIGGNTSTETVELRGGKRTRTIVSGGQPTTEVATLNDAKWRIRKDATWERTVSYTTVDTNDFTNVITTKNITLVESGNWDFLTGVGEFKKNERVSFSTTNAKTTTITTNTQSNGSSTTATNTDTKTYADGENAEIYVIEESKKKSLSLKFTGSSSSSTQTQGGAPSTSKETLDKSYTLSSN